MKMSSIILTLDEVHMLAIALARHVEPDSRPTSAHEASRIVWNSPNATGIQRSIATALAEQSY